MTEMSSPILHAKKQARDAKRKKLEEMFDSHKKHEQILVTHQAIFSVTSTGESSCEERSPTASTETKATERGDSKKDASVEHPSYATSSYQHTSIATQEAPSHRSNTSSQQVEGDIEQGEKRDTGQTKGALSYGGVSIANEEVDDGLSLRTEVQSLIHNDAEDAIQYPSTVLEKLENNPQQFLGAFFLFLFVLWWL